jgi:hypothetical protein
MPSPYPGTGDYNPLLLGMILERIPRRQVASLAVKERS